MDGDQSAIEGLLVLTGDGEPSNTKQSEVVLTWSDDETRTVIVAANEDEAEVWLSSEDMTSSIDGNLEPEQALETTLPTAGQGYWTVGAEEADLGTIYSFEVLSAEAPFTARVFSPRGEILDEGSGEAINPVLLSAPVSDVGSYVIVVHADDDTVDPHVGLALQQLTAQPTEQSCGMSHENVTYGDVDYGSRVVLGQHTDFEGEMYWASDMANYVGQIAIVEELAGLDSVGCPIVRVDVDLGNYLWRIRDMQLLEP